MFQVSISFDERRKGKVFSLLLQITAIKLLIEALKESFRFLIPKVVSNLEPM